MGFFVPNKDALPQGARWGTPIADGWHQATILGNKGTMTKDGTKPLLKVTFELVGADGTTPAKLDANLSIDSPGFAKFIDVMQLGEGELDDGALAGMVIFVKTLNKADRSDPNKIWCNPVDFSLEDPEGGADLYGTGG